MRSFRIFCSVRLFGNGTLGLVTVFSSGATGVGGLGMDVVILKGVEFTSRATMSLDDLLDGGSTSSFYVVEERIFHVYTHKLCYSCGRNSHGQNDESFENVNESHT